jgi:Ca2+-binding EF-hand superfamily protein
MKAAHFYAVAAATLLPISGAFAQSSTPAQGEPQQQGATFESLDKDSDGRISKTEAAANANVTAQFSSYDLNGNGFIEKEEVTNANNARSTTPEDKK